MAPKRVIGLDLSISCTGVAGNGWSLIIPTAGYTKKKKKDPLQEERNRIDNHHARLDRIITEIVDHVRYADMVIMESLAFESHDMGRQNAGLAWIVRHTLHRKGIPYALVPPSNLKSYATGNGSASKEMVMAAVEGWFPGCLDAYAKEEKDNAADAIVLVAMAYDYLGEPIAGVKPGIPAKTSRRKVIDPLAGCHWPLLASDEDSLLLAA